jgi:outer membrane protein
MKKLVVAFAVLAMFAAVPAAAQDRSVDIIGNVSWVDISGDNTFEGSIDDFDVEFDSDMGYGLGINVFWGERVSTEFAASLISPEVTFNPTNGGVPGFLAGDLEMIPITATLQYHFAPNSRIDPYVGAGAAYVLFDDIDDSEDLDDIDVDSIEFDDDAGFVVNAGVDFSFSDSFALNLDAKYVPVEASANATFASGPGQAFDVEVNPLILSAGLRLKF